jgi:transcriptional regulator with XRE-family HTH domain
MDKRLLYPTVMPRDAQKDEELLASSTAKVLGDNLRALMAANPELGSNPKLAAKTRLGTGTISRMKNGAVDANLDTLERIAAAFGVEPWQLLVPGIEPGNLPTLQPISEQERRLYDRIAEAFRGIRGS